MERDLQLDWPRLVEEAVKRRMSLGLTQKELAVLAGVSGPTVNRLERRSANITLKSALAILRIVGLVLKPARAVPTNEAGVKRGGKRRNRRLKRGI